ncbi:MAG: SDR family oxidoreductase [Acidobacteria bacterium]|nr:SDR family oxidoreductase [Acidobacteriota bacterium]
MFGKRALVTGAGTGIGRSIALELAREGADVMLHHSHEAGGALAAVEEIRSHGGKAAVLPGDLSRMGDIHALAKGTLRFLGGIDILVNNAGISMNEPFATVTVEQFDLLYAVNIRAMYFLTQALLPGLISGGNGTVINMSSIQALAGNSENSVYGGTKGAVISFSRHLAIELAPKGVRVNAIAPGAIEVESYYLAMPDFDPQSFGRKIPAGMVGQPWDVARAVVFLASEDARYIIGHTLIVDGGTSAWHAFSEDFRKPSTAVWGKGYVKGR